MQSNITNSTNKLCTVILSVCIASQRSKGQKVHKNNEICRMKVVYLKLTRKSLVIIETSHKSQTTFHLENLTTAGGCWYFW